MPELTIPTAQRMSSSGLIPVDSTATPSSSVRPRNRRLISTNSTSASPSPSRGASPIPSARVGSVTGRNNAGPGVASSPRSKIAPAVGSSSHSTFSSGLLQGSWAPSWSSVQEFASSLLAGGDGDEQPARTGSRSRSRGRPTTRKQVGNQYLQKNSDAWGPNPPDTRPRLEDVASGSRAEREEALKAVKKKSVLESHDGVNGGLDVSGKFKKRSSDENLRSSSQAEEVEEQLVYIHHVKADDTYAGIILKYRCRGDAFRKANGLWSRDNIQVRKWLALPVDACETKGRPCAAPSASPQVDLLARTPEDTGDFGRDGPTQQDDFFGRAPGGKSTEQAKTDDGDRPWTHVKWVSIDSIPHPVEIARMSRRSLGYFPPRRKKSLVTASTLSTPRGSIDVPSIAVSSEAAADSPQGATSPRHSGLNNRPQFSAAYGLSTPSSARSRVGSGGDELKPAWMRRPGGVGSLGRHVRAPGPEKDYFNSWTKKHLPSLNIESLPSMSVMGSESARFGFSGSVEENPGIVESPFEEGRDAESNSRQGSGLDKAAAAIETWLRGAFARRPSTPVLGPRGRPGFAAGQGPEIDGDLIELEESNSDENERGGFVNDSGRSDFTDTGLLSQGMYGSSSGSGVGDGMVRGRFGPGGSDKGKKAD